MSTELVAIKMGAGLFAKPIEDACIRFGIVTTLQKAHFLAQMSVESAGFRCVRENLNYSVERLLTLFGRHRISSSDAHKYGRLDKLVNGRRVTMRQANQEMIANLVYGGDWGRDNLGNMVYGDGWAHIGRGLKQLTGLHNYAQYSLAMYGDMRVVKDTAMLEELPDCALSAGWFWQSRGLNEIAAHDDVVKVTKKVNGGLNGLDARKAALIQAKEYFKQITQ